MFGRHEREQCWVKREKRFLLFISMPLINEFRNEYEMTVELDVISTFMLHWPNEYMSSHFILNSNAIQCRVSIHWQNEITKSLQKSVENSRQRIVNRMKSNWMIKLEVRNSYKIELFSTQL